MLFSVSFLKDPKGGDLLPYHINPPKTPLLRMVAFANVTSEAPYSRPAH